jgi:hypothetical protein
MTRKTLVFPAGTPLARSFLRLAESRGETVVGASSHGDDPCRSLYANWLTLPYLHAPDFDDALVEAVRTHRITALYCPHLWAWEYLRKKLPRLLPDVELNVQHPLDTELRIFRESMARASAWPPGTCDRRLSAMERAALLKHAETIPGASDDAKIDALCRIFATCPRGDLVEIGSFWGKSAFVLLRLAQLHAIGKLLCVDPWSDSAAGDQRESSDEIAAVRDRLDFQEAFEVFLVNLLPYARGDLNYLRLPADRALSRYGPSCSVSSEEFGETVYEGRLACLHVDGNHDYEFARRDIEQWGKLVIPGGWLIVDDYVWTFGDGPRRAADAFVERHRRALSENFVAGGALFLRLGGTIA